MNKSFIKILSDAGFGIDAEILSDAERGRLVRNVEESKKALKAALNERERVEREIEESKKALDAALDELYQFEEREAAARYWANQAELWTKRAVEMAAAAAEMAKMAAAAAE